MKPDEKRCLECHNKKSPFFKEFDFKKRLEAIKHGEKLVESK